MDVPFRLAIALFVIFAPTVLFLGLWHGLMSLRDDDLAGAVTARQLRGLFATLPSGQPNASRFEEIPDGGIEATVAESLVGDAPRLDEPHPEGSKIEIGVETDSIECARCDEPNPPTAELCWGCGAYLNHSVKPE